MTEQGSVYSEDNLPPPEAPHFADRHLATAIMFAAMDDVDQMHKQLLQELPPQIDRSVVDKAYLYILLAHGGQPRDHRPGVDFLVHPLAVASLTVATFGENTTTDQVVIALLHDVIEKGEIDERPITRREVQKHFGDTVAHGVYALSNRVRGQRKLELPEYCQQILDVDSRHPQLQLPVLKVLADRMLNYFDPVITPLPEGAVAGRRKKTNDPSGPITKILLADDKYAPIRQVVSRAAQISKLTLDRPEFNPRVWAANRLGR